MSEMPFIVRIYPSQSVGKRVLRQHAGSRPCQYPGHNRHDLTDDQDVQSSLLFDKELLSPALKLKDLLH